MVEPLILWLRAGVVKLADARDSKSRDPQGREGSTPSSGIFRFRPTSAAPGALTKPSGKSSATEGRRRTQIFVALVIK